MTNLSDVVHDINNYANLISQLYFKLEVKKIVSGQIDTQTRKDVEIIVVGLKNAIAEFDRKFRDEASKEIIEKVDTFEKILNSQIPQIVKPQS
jgi:hypothetical protein